jgi:hypothetical protein
MAASVPSASTVTVAPHRERVRNTLSSVAVRWASTQRWIGSSHVSSTRPPQLAAAAAMARNTPPSATSSERRGSSTEDGVAGSPAWT